MFRVVSGLQGTFYSVCCYMYIGIQNDQKLHGLQMIIIALSLQEKEAGA